MNIFNVCAFSVACAAVLVILRRIQPEIASIAAAIAGVIIFAFSVSSLAPFIAFATGLAEESGGKPYFELMLKSLAVSFCCRISADICTDCGESLLASRVMLAGKICIVVMTLPVVQQLLTFAKDMFA